MTKPLIEPKILKGFRDYLPQAAIPRIQMIRKLEEVFESFGFAPIDTPALEYTEIILGKGSDETDKQMYRFLDNGERDISLRFDLTVPLARFAAMHIHELGTPFKRFHIAPVWRAEKPQKGRYREFIQCDFDIIGSKSLTADAEILSIIHTGFKKLSVNHKVRINNRKVLNGLLQSLNAREKSASVLRTIDKLDKLGEETVRMELGTEAGLNEANIKKVFDFLALSKSNLKNRDLLKEVRGFLSDSELAQEGLSDLNTILNIVSDVGVDDTCCAVDLSIARGLDYYTATVFETQFTDCSSIGSVCSGGRYDNLASLYTKQELPGVGASFGLDRILAGLEEVGKLSNIQSTAHVLIAVLDEGSEGKCFALATKLRNSKINAEVFLEKAKLGNQIKYANRKGIKYLIIAGNEELSNETYNLKNLETGEQKDKVSFEDICKQITAL